MAVLRSYQCDECSVTKQESNHWVLIFPRDRQLNIVPWQDNLASGAYAVHLCGAGCAAKILSKQIHEWSLQSVVDLVT
jgi:hypothetical protein